MTAWSTALKGYSNVIYMFNYIKYHLTEKFYNQPIIKPYIYRDKKKIKKVINSTSLSRLLFPCARYLN